MKRAGWAAVAAVFGWAVLAVGFAVPAAAQDAGVADAPDAGTAETPPPNAPSSFEAASAGQADTAPPNAGGLHADLLGANIPLRFTLNGYYRARYVYANRVPGARGLSDTTDPQTDASYAFMRLRLEPSITYGSNPETPIVALRAQFDVLDNVVFGDNARLMSTPLFAESPSATSLTTGTDNNFLYVRRVWLEFLMPIGLIRVGRQGSHGGLGLLFNDGNGFRNDWGDATGGSTFDRILFATRPLTIFNTLTRGDSRSTPLVLAVGYDWLTQDVLGYDTTPAPRPTFPFEFVTHGQDAVSQGILVLAWNDPKVNPNRTTDELSLGLIGVNRVQGTTNSNVWIYDAFWRARYSVFGNRGIQPFTNGEIYTIQGTTQGVGLKGLAIDPMTGRTDRQLNANIWGGVVQVGVASDQKWQIMLEGGYATGDAHLFAGDPTRTLSQRAMSADYHVGLLLFPMAVYGRSSNVYFGPLNALNSRGGVWNASYLYPQIRYRVFNGVDILAAFLLAWADQVAENVYGNVYLADPVTNPSPATQAACGFLGTGASRCFLGWELDLGLKVSWGPNDLMRWSNEFGFMEAGDVLALELRRSFMWTFQSRFAMSF